MDKIRITGLTEDGLYSRVSINGRSVHVRAYDIHHESQSIPKVTLYAESEVVLEETGNVEWVATPATMAEAINVLATAVVEGKAESSEIVKQLCAGINAVKRREQK